MAQQQFSGCIKATAVRELLGMVAAEIPTTAQVTSSVDLTNPYEQLFSFAFNESVISLSVMNMKGGAL